MASWGKEEIVLPNGEKVSAQMPVIVSASRSTDIPAFYADWFMERLREGFVKWYNPFNGAPLHVSLRKARLFVFWSKNPEPMLAHLDELDRICPNYYFQFTLNDYFAEGIEPRVPPVDDRLMVKCFPRDAELMKFIGARHVPGDMFAADEAKRFDHWEPADVAQKDSGQRAACGCVMSKDIGEYNTCPHLCHYCYANTSNATALANWRRHRECPHAATITGR